MIDPQLQAEWESVTARMLAAIRGEEAPAAADTEPFTPDLASIFSGCDPLPGVETDRMRWAIARVADQARAHYEPQLAELREQNSRLKDAWGVECGQHGTTRNERDTLQKRVTKLEDQHRLCSDCSHMNDLRSQLREAKEERDQFAREARDGYMPFKRERDALQKRVAELRSEVAVLSDANSELECQVEDHMKQLETRGKQLAAVTAERDAALACTARAQLKIDAFDKRIKEQRDERAKQDYAWFSRLSSLASRWLTDGPNAYEGQAAPDELLDRELARLTERVTELELERDGTRQNLQTILDEAFGPWPEESIDALLTQLERHLAEDRMCGAEATTQPTLGPWVELSNDAIRDIVTEALRVRWKHATDWKPSDTVLNDELAACRAVLEASRPKGAAVFTGHLGRAGTIGFEFGDTSVALWLTDGPGTFYGCFVPEAGE